MVEIAQLVEHQIVTLGVAGSIPVLYPICPVSSVGTSVCLTSRMSAVRSRHRAPFYGGLVEWFKAVVLKTTGGDELSLGSNPRASARKGLAFR